MKITKAQFDALPDDLKVSFKAIVPEGKTEADATEYSNGEEDPGGLKTALEKEKEAKKKAAQERDALQKKHDDAEAERRAAAAKKAAEEGDFSKIEEGYKEQLAAEKRKREEAENALDAERTRGVIDSIVNDISSIFVVPEAQSAMVRSRLRVDIVDGKPVVRVLDALGNVTALEPEALKNEFLTTTKFKPILTASKGSGGGSTIPSGGGGSTPTKLSDFKSATEESIFANKNPEVYRKMLDAEKKG